MFPPDRWASLNVDPRGPSYRAPFGKRPDDEIRKALEALHVPPRPAWEAPVPRGPFGEPGLMLRHHVSLKDYLPGVWDEIQARYNRPLDTVQGAFTAAAQREWKKPRNAEVTVTLRARAPTDSMPNTITGLSDLLSKIPPPAPQPDTILGGPDVVTNDPIERQPPDFRDRIRRSKDRFEWGPTGQGQGWGSLANGPTDMWGNV